jgi:hypothetical protein
MERKLIILLVIPFFMYWHWFDQTAKKNQQGIELYQQNHYADALKEFMAAKGFFDNKKTDSPAAKPDQKTTAEEHKQASAIPDELVYNTASTLYQLNKYKEALAEFSQIDAEKTGLSKADFHYNLGNSFYKTEDYQNALSHFKKSMTENPDDLDAKRNFELTLKKIKEQEKEQDKKDEQDDKEKDKQDQQNQQNQEQQQQQQQQDHQDVMNYLNQNEKNQMEKKKRAIGITRNEKDW